MSRCSVALVCLALGCGQTTTDAPASGGGGSSGTGGEGGGCVGTHWRWLPPSPGASPRTDHGATAFEGDVFVWGGRFEKLRGDGVRIPAGPSASPISLPDAGAPSPRMNHAMVVAGGMLVVWGGDGYEQGVLGDGARFDPVAGVWTPVASVGAPSARGVDKFGVVGGGLLVWDGYTKDGVLLSDGALYDLNSDSWSPVDPAPLQCFGCVTVTAGEYGVLTHGELHESKEVAGYLFDAKTGKWKLPPTDGQIGARDGAVAVWSPANEEVIIWGGGDASKFRDDGARFSIPEWKWKAMSGAGAPSARSGAAGAVLPALGEAGKLVVFGGTGVEGLLATGGIYDIATDTWTPLPKDECAPPARALHSMTVLGAGDRAVVWGGIGSDKLNPAPEQGWVLSPE
ncbi:MAG: hypothetical protein IPI67_39535 [Myxococcales bacterium]|nr:hypothetical protein [Myxococcales bacterium]